MRKWIFMIAAVLILCGGCVLVWVQSVHARKLADLQAKGKSATVKNYEQDFAAARHALQRNPNDPDAHLGLARHYSKQHDYFQSAKEAQQTLQAQPGNEEAQYTEARALYKSGQQPAALRIWQQLAAQHTPWGLKARKRLYKLETNKRSTAAQPGT